MLEIIVEPVDGWDPTIEEFVKIPGGQLVLEHSLVSLSKWESKWHKPFLSESTKTADEILDYIKCMTIRKSGDDSIYNYLSDKNLNDIRTYMNDSRTATTFIDFAQKHSRMKHGEFITSELIYYWMIELNIPFECQKWHIERLFTLIRVCNEQHEANSNNKNNRQAILQRNRALNESRRAKLKARNSR